MIRLLFYLLVSLCVLQEGIGAEPSPVVVLPANFRWGAQNEILVSPIRTMDPNTTFLTIISLDIRTADSKRTVFSKNILQLSNKPKIIKFPLSQEEKYASAYKVSIKADGHDAFEKVVYGTPDIRSIEIQTDKVFYKKGETVKVRALPITERGEIYRGPISFNLWNPHNFKLTNKTGWAEDRYIGLEFELPEELQYGEWKVVAVPYDNLGQEVSEKSMAYAAAFEVQDYVLPLIQVLIDAKVTKDSEIPLFTVCAQYSHGTRLNGSVKIECRSAGFAENRYLTHLTMMNGIVASQVKVSECFPDKHTTSTTIIAKVRDESTSATAETRYELDIRVAGFDLVPLRPAFSSRTLDFYVYVKPTGSSFEDLPDVVHMNVTCLADRSNKVTSYKAKIGEILPINGDWSSFYECSAIVIFAQRAISDVMLSRNVTLIIGNMSTSSTTNFNLINPENPTKKGYKVGEEFRATVSEAAAEYMVICNMRDVAAHGQVAQQTIRFTVTEKMIPQCVLYVYTFNKDKPSTDMWLFFVENVCPYTANANASEISPSDKLRIDVTGPKNGLALLHIVDSRMFGLLERVLMYGPSTYWEMDSFGTEIPSRLRLSNFIDDADFRFHLGKTCREAGFYYKRHSSAPCPSAGRSSSGISNYCQQLLTKSCLSDAPRPYDGPVEALLQRPTTKTKVTSSSAVSFDIRAPQSPTIIRSQVVQDDDTIPKGVVTDLVKVRQHFPEVWLFNDLALDQNFQPKIPYKTNQILQVNGYKEYLISVYCT
uniref:A2M_N_2 domain-containing protein n=1 Tax=Steinernema glaseri TaxID=37863 RepID=A0A1I7YPR5_9BILA